MRRKYESGSHDVDLSGVEDAGPVRRRVESGPCENSREPSRSAADACSQT